MFVKTLQILTVLLSTMCFAQNASQACDVALINTLIAQDTPCIVGRSADKLYLNPNTIIPTEQGLYLHINNENYILLPTLHSDHQGCYIPITTLDAESIAECGSRASPTPTWQCPYCFYWWKIDEQCTNPKCPTNQWKNKE